MLDVISGGRLIAGFVVGGVGGQSTASTSNPTTARPLSGRRTTSSYGARTRPGRSSSTAAAPASLREPVAGAAPEAASARLDSVNRLLGAHQRRRQQLRTNTRSSPESSTNITCSSRVARRRAPHRRAAIDARADARTGVQSRQRDGLGPDQREPARF